MRDWSVPLTTIDDAQAYFRAMGCSHFHMLREYPERYAEYRALSISEEKEFAWRRAEFDESLQAITSGATAAEEIWAKHLALEGITESLKQLDSLRRFYDLTLVLVPVVPNATRILVAETIVGRGSEIQSSGPMPLAVALRDRALAGRFADLVPAFCDGSSAPNPGPPINDRRAAVLERLRTLRRRLHLQG